MKLRISQEQLECIRRDIVKAFTPKETPVSKHPETTTEWLEDIALELHAVTALLNERLPVVHPGADKCEEVERLTRERDEWKTKAERVDDAARHWMNRCHAAEEKAEAERDDWRSKFEQTDDLLSRTRDECDFQTKRADDFEGLLQAARADRDTWEAAYKRADDERDTALTNQQVSAASLTGALEGGHEWHRRYEALREGIRGSLNESRDMQSEMRSSVTLAYLQCELDDLLDPTEGETDADA